LANALKEYYPEQRNLIDLFNIDLPNAADILSLIDDLSRHLKAVEIRKHSVSLGAARKHGKPITLNIPLWDQNLIFDQLYVVLYPAFKWLRLFSKTQLEKLVRSHLITLHSDNYLLDYTEEEAKTIKKTAKAQVGAYFKDQYNKKGNRNFHIHWETTAKIKEMFLQ
jgi:hypothetical protein